MAIESIGAQRSVNPFLSGISGGNGSHPTPAAVQMRGVEDSRGSAWNGFETPEFNGTGELQPVTKDATHGNALCYMA